MRIDFSQLEQNEPQLSETNSSFSGSLPQIWKNAFKKQKSLPIIEVDQEEPCLSFFVDYPYEITRSISPSAINKQLAYLQAKKILPTSTLKFIQNTLHAQILKQTESQRNKQDLSQSTSQQQIPFEKIIEKQHQSFGLTNKLKSVSRNQNTNNNQKKKKGKYDNTKPRVYDNKKKEMRSQKYRIEQDLDITLKPILNYTMNSKTAKKVDQKRNHHFKTYQTNVFESLYYDAAVYSTKKQMKKMSIQEEQYSRVIKRHTSRVNIFSTFQQRLQTSIEKDAQRKKAAQNKLEFDLSTGQKLFVPDTKLSKVSYFTLFKSLSPQNPIYSQSYDSKCRNNGENVNKSLEKITALSNSYEKTIHNSLDSKYKIVRKSLPKQNKLAQFYADLLWRQQQLKEDNLTIKQKNILHLFLQQIKSHYRSYSKNVSKQVFIAFFKQVYARLNLFDRAILDNRVKKLKKQQKQSKKIKNELFTDRKKQQFMLSTKNWTERQKTISESSLDHTSKHFFI